MSADRAEAATRPGRALRITSSILTNGLSAWGWGSHRVGGGRATGAVVVVLMLLDERLHAESVALLMAVTANRALAAAGFDEDVGQQNARVDLH